MHFRGPLRRCVPVLSAFLLACTSAAPPQAAAPLESSVATRAAAPAESDRAVAIDVYLDSVYDPAEPGAAVLVSRGGETVLRDAYGMADLELGVELRPEHVFRIGSITKQFTAVGILLLAQEGKLSLDDEITRFLPDYPTHGHRITIEDLLRHTSGIRSYTGMPGLQAMMRTDLALDSLIARFRDEPLNFPPRTDWRYSNSGYVLLGKIIEEASGQEYAAFVRERLFEPAGMESSYYGSASRIIPNRAKGYQRADDGWRNAAYLSMTLPHAAGALLSTVDDLARWTRALESGELVDPALLERAHTPGVLEDGRSTGYGYGWMLGRAFGRETIEHGGGINGFLTYALRIPEADLFVSVLTNRAADDPSPQQVALRVASLALGETDELPTVELPAEALREFVGVYRVDERERRQITLEKGRLYSQRTGGEKYEIVPVAEDVFVFPESRTRMEFERDEAGEVVRMRMRPRTGPESVAPLTDEPPISVGTAPPDVLEAAVTPIRERLRSLADTGMGISVAVATAEGAIWSEAHGYADADEGRPATPRTRFRIYSIAKPMTAVAAARLMERGELDPSSAVQTYVPAFSEKASTITPMQLATHTSGIRHYAGEAESRSRLHCDSVDDALAIFSDDPLVHAPGTRETYSSWGYVLLSAVVQGASGHPYSEAMDELVFGPAGMTETALDDPTRATEDRASFYREAEDGTRVPAAEVDNTCKWGAGGFVSTAEDVALFGRAMIDGSLISDRSLELFLRGEPVYSAQGIGAGGTAFLIVDAEHELAISLLSNITGNSIGPALREVASDLHRSVAAAYGEPRQGGTGGEEMSGTCPDGDPKAAIAKVREAYMRAFNEGRIDDLIELHAEDVISMPAGMPLLEGRDALHDLVTESFRNAPEGFRFAFEAEDLRIADGWAVERGITRAHMDDEGPGIPGGKYVMLYERDDEGCWRIAWSITNSDRERGSE